MTAPRPGLEPNGPVCQVNARAIHDVAKPMAGVIIVPMSWQLRSRAHGQRRAQGTSSVPGPWTSVFALVVLIIGILLFLSGGRP